MERREYTGTQRPELLRHGARFADRVQKRLFEIKVRRTVCTGLKMDGHAFLPLVWERSVEIRPQLANNLAAEIRMWHASHPVGV